MGNNIAPGGKNQVCGNDRVHIAPQKPITQRVAVDARSKDLETDRRVAIERIPSQRSLLVAAITAGKGNGDRRAREERLAGIRVATEQGDPEVHREPLSLVRGDIISAVEDAGVDIVFVR